MRKAIRRGDLFYADLNPVVGSEQGGIRPVLVIQNDVGNHFSPTVVAAAITSRKAKNSLPTHMTVFQLGRAGEHAARPHPSGLSYRICPSIK